MKIHFEFKYLSALVPFVYLMTAISPVSVSGQEQSGTSTDAPQYNQQYAQPPAGGAAGVSDNAVQDAMKDALTETDTQTWFLIGCAFGITGWIISAIIDPSPSAIRLLGKSPEYIAVYSDTYKREVKRIRSKKAMTGCVCGYGAIAAIYVGFIVFVLAMESSSGPY